LLPFAEECTVRIKDLDTVVGPVGDVNTARRIDRQRMIHPKFAGAGTAPAPRHDELAVRGELDDPGIGVAAMSVTDDDIAVTGNRDIRRSIEHVGTVACDPGFAKREQNLALWTEFDDLMAFAVAAGVVGRPYAAVTIDVETMRMVEVTLAKGQQKFSRSIEFFDGITCRVDTVSFSAAFEDPDALAVGIDIHACHLPHLEAIGHLQPIRVEGIWIGGAIRIGWRLCRRFRSRRGTRDRDGSKQQHQFANAEHGFLLMIVFAPF
jgi:hypothetical protein